MSSHQKAAGAAEHLLSGQSPCRTRPHRAVLRPGYDEPVPRPALRAETYDGLPVEWVLVPSPPSWAKKLGVRKTWQERTARRLLAKRAYKLAMTGNADILHGQHKVSVGAASVAAHKARADRATVASVATVRDDWPRCPVSTRLFTRRDGSGFECRDCQRFSRIFARSQAQAASRLFRWLLPPSAGFQPLRVVAYWPGD